ncbi:ABC transporter permease subunit [Streptomyces sp. NPDC052095]|uniref:ABC transporter permease subunit n=1 Tax=unclassified Streptomyces TaxID=2593676 RepID=UPI00344E5DAC
MSTLALSGPVRVTLRQHRTTLWTVGTLALAGIASVVIARLVLSSATDTFADTDCSVRKVTEGCGIAVRHFLSVELHFHRLLQYAALVMMLLPVFVGMFVAGPMIARELESGTFRLSWSQGISPARWLAAKLAVPAAATVAGVSVLSAVFGWAASRTDRTQYPLDMYDRDVYGSMGTAPVGYTLCMLALGALAGLLLRRTVPAMIATVVAFAPLTALMNRVREDLWPTVRTTENQWIRDNTTWLVDSGTLTASGKPLDPAVCGDPGAPAACKGAVSYVDYHPLSHFWPLQLVETGILLAVAALAVALAFRVLRGLHA